MTKEPLKILIISDRAEEIHALRQLLSRTDRIRIIGEGETEQDAIRLLSIAEVDLIMVGAGTYGIGYNLTARLARLKAPKPIILIIRELSRAARRRALESGASEVVLFPFDQAQLAQAITSLAPQVGERIQGDSAAAAKQAISDRARWKIEQKTRRGRLLTFFSTKGGVGKTFCSVNTAVALAEISNQRVILVDLDFDYGSAALILNVDSRRSLIELISNNARLDSNLIDNYPLSHESGLKVLPGGSLSRDGVGIKRLEIETVLAALLGAYDYVVLDMPTRIPGFLVPSLELASLIFPVTTPDIAGVRNIRLFLKMLLGTGYPVSRVRLLLNRADSRTGISPGDIETALNEKIYKIIPADYKLATLSLNRGSPIVRLFPRSRVSRAFYNLADKILLRED
jgi:pilus assembly protein CpaE